MRRMARVHVLRRGVDLNHPPPRTRRNRCAYRYVYTHYRLLELDPKAHVLLYYFALLFGKDLLYYTAHRFMHEYHVGWISHSVHHSGEDYNLGTGLRQGVLQGTCPCYIWVV